MIYGGCDDRRRGPQEVRSALAFFFVSTEITGAFRLAACSPLGDALLPGDLRCLCHRLSPCRLPRGHARTLLVQRIPGCGETKLRIHDIKLARQWRHLDTWNVPTMVRSTLRRVRQARAEARASPGGGHDGHGPRLHQLSRGARAAVIRPPAGSRHDLVRQTRPRSHVAAYAHGVAGVNTARSAAAPRAQRPSRFAKPPSYGDVPTYRSRMCSQAECALGVSEVARWSGVRAPERACRVESVDQHLSE